MVTYQNRNDQKYHQSLPQQGDSSRKQETLSTLHNLQAVQQVGWGLSQVSQSVLASYRQLGWSLPLSDDLTCLSLF